MSSKWVPSESYSSYDPVDSSCDLYNSTSTGIVTYNKSISIYKSEFLASFII